MTISRTLALSGLILGLGLGAGTLALADSHKGMRDGRGLERMFDAMDANADGSITREELAAHRDTRFDTADADADGTVTEDELVAAMMKRVSSDEMRTRAARMISRMDKDEDGALSMEELAASPMDRMFDRLDKDGDGAVTRAEAEAAKKRMGGGKDKRG